METPLVIPNLPGYSPLTADNWYVRTATSTFKRGKDGKRPQSAGPVGRARATGSIPQTRDLGTTQWEKQYIGAMDVMGLGLQDQSQFQIDGSQVGGGPSVVSMASSRRPKTSGGGVAAASRRKQRRQQQEAAFHPQPQQFEPMLLAEGRSRFAGPISPVKSQIRRMPENAGPMTMGRDTSHVHSTSPFGRDRFITATNTTTSAAAAAAGAATVAALDRCGYPVVDVPPKPVVDHDKRVCRYSAFFYEDRVWDAKCPIGTPSIERIVVRHLVISYYLADNTVSIFEKKQENVGIGGGKFFKRAQLYKDDDAEPVRLKDLIPGQSIRVLGQEIMVRDADSFSRGVAAHELGITLPPGLPKPLVAREDLGVHLALGMGRQPLPKRTDNLYPPAYDFYQRKAALLKTHRFLFAERTPAAFECYELLDNVAAGKVPQQNYNDWAERINRGDSSMPLIVPCNAQRLVLLYYMADYQVEVTLCFKAGEKVEHVENRTVLKKSKLPKNWYDVSKGREAVFFEPRDFMCGQTIDLYGRIYIIVSCNPWTRGVYAKDFGIEQVDVNVRVEDKPSYIHEIPKFGEGNLPIGTPEETLATVYGHAHAGHALRKDQKNLGRQLRCKTVLITDQPGHDRRMFNVSFYMEDSTIQVYEEVVKNSGFPGGMFIKRARVLNHLPPDQNEPRVFKHQDIYLGNVMSFNGVEMRIVEMDGASLRFCEQHPQDFPMSDVFDIILRGLAFIIENAVNVRNAFFSFDANRSGMLSRTNFIEALDSMGLTEQLNDQELLTLIRRFKFEPNHKKKRNIFSAKSSPRDDDEDAEEEEAKDKQDGDGSGEYLGAQDRGKYLYEELCDLFSHVHCVDQRKRQPSRGIQHMESLEMLLYEGRACTTQWRRVIRLDPNSFDGLLGLDALSSCMLRYGVALSDNTKRQFAARYAASPEERARYVAQQEKNVNGRLLKLQINDGKRKIPAGTTAALATGGNGASARFEVESVGPGSPTFVQQRREMLQRPVLRTVKPTETKRSPSATLAALAAFDEKAVVIKVRELCDNIYVSDWVMVGEPKK